MVTVLPGIDESLGPRIRALGQAIYARSGLARKRMIEESILKRPEVAQEFADLEYKTPGTLQRLGFGDIKDYISNIKPSVNLEVQEKTREDIIPTAVAKSKTERSIAEQQNAIIEEFKGAETPEQRAIAYQKLSQIPTLGQVREEQAKAAPMTGANVEQIAQAIANFGTEGLSSNAVLAYQANKDIIDQRVDSLQKEVAKKNQNRVEEANNVLGQALQIADELSEGGFNFPQFQDVLQRLQQSNPEMVGDPQKAGLLGTAAEEAIKSVMSRGARTQEERRLASFYTQSFPASRVLEDLSNGKGTEGGKPVKWNTKMDLATSLMRAAAGVDSGLGFGDAESTKKGDSKVLTSSGRRTLTQYLDEAVNTISKTSGKSAGVTNLIGKLTSLRTHINTSGDVTSEDIPSALLTQAAQALMSDDEQRFFTNSLRFIEGVLRQRTGFRIERKEFQDYVNQFIPREIEGGMSVTNKSDARGTIVEQLRLDAKLRRGYYEELQNSILKTNQINDPSRNYNQTTPIRPPSNANPPFSELIANSPDATADTINTLLEDSKGDTRSAFGALMGKIGQIPERVMGKAQNVFRSLMSIDNTIEKIKDNKNIPNRLNYIESLEQRKKQIISDTKNNKTRNFPVEQEIQMMLQAMYPLDSDSARLTLLRNVRKAGASDLVINEVMKQLKLDPKLLEEY